MTRSWPSVLILNVDYYFRMARPINTGKTKKGIAPGKLLT